MYPAIKASPFINYVNTNDEQYYCNDNYHKREGMLGRIGNIVNDSTIRIYEFIKPSATLHIYQLSFVIRKEESIKNSYCDLPKQGKYDEDYRALLCHYNG